MKKKQKLPKSRKDHFAGIDKYDQEAIRKVTETPEYKADMQDLIKMLMNGYKRQEEVRKQQAIRSVGYNYRRGFITRKKAIDELKDIGADNLEIVDKMETWDNKR